jgi:hypothetical protein
MIGVSHNRCATTVAPVDHADHGVVEVFAQAFFEKACGQAFHRKGCDQIISQKTYIALLRAFGKAFRRGGLQSKAYLKKGCNTELK